MATLKKELREILDRYGIDPRDKSQIWDCHGTLVLYHRAYEVIAAKEGIKFDAPVIIESDSKEKIVAMLVVGHMNDRSEWSIGEAAPANCKNTYPYAMAEKRAKDRVIAKLAGLAAYVYSEAEADEFKDGVPVEATETPASARSASPPPSHAGNGTAQPAATSGHQSPAAAAAKRRQALEARDRIRTAMEKAGTPKLIDEIIAINSHDLQIIKEVGPQAYENLMTLANGRKSEMFGETG